MKAKSKIHVDAGVVKMLNEYYYAKLDDRYVGWECFSDPQLTSHICNSSAKLENGQDCTYCKHVVERRCKVTCHIHHFCLAALGFRLGIGNPSGRTTFKNGMEANLKLPYATLYQLVQERSAQDGADPAHPHAAAQAEAPPPKKKRKRREPDPVYDDDGVELLTVKKAAALYGCTYVRMHGYLKKGKIRRIEIGKRPYARRDEVEAYKKSLEEK